MIMSRGQRQVIHQLDNLASLLHEHLVLTRQANAISKNRMLDMDMDTVICPLIFLTVGSVAYFIYKGLSRNWFSQSMLLESRRRSPSESGKKTEEANRFKLSAVLQTLYWYISCKLKKGGPQNHLDQEDHIYHFTVWDR
jgi:hypothetical protein